MPPTLSSFRSSAAAGQLLMIPGERVAGMGMAGRACMLAGIPDMLPATQAVTASATMWSG